MARARVGSGRVPIGTDGREETWGAVQGFGEAWPVRGGSPASPRFNARPPHCLSMAPQAGNPSTQDQRHGTAWGMAPITPAPAANRRSQGQAPRGPVVSALVGAAWGEHRALRNGLHAGQGGWMAVPLSLGPHGRCQRLPADGLGPARAETAQPRSLQMRAPGLPPGPPHSSLTRGVRCQMDPTAPLRLDGTAISLP